jgi:hypothetical protein
MNKSLADQLKPLRPVVEANRTFQALDRHSTAQLKGMLNDPAEAHNHTRIYSLLQQRKCASNSKRRSSNNA